MRYRGAGFSHPADTASVSLPTLSNPQVIGSIPIGENWLKPDAVPEASFPCERQQAGVGPAALEERWSCDSRGGVRRVRRGRIGTPAGDGVLAVRRLAHR